MALTAEQEREQANSGTKEVAETHRFDEAKLFDWMTANVEGFAGPLEVRQFKGGQSNPTYQLVTPSKKYVLRRKPPGVLLPSAHAVDREFKLLSGLYPTGFPVARPYALCEDDSVIGTMFYVMDMVEGRILWDQSLPAYTPEQRMPIYMAQVKTLADLHNTDYVAAGLADYGRPGNYFARQISRWTKQYKASEDVVHPHIDELIEFLTNTILHADEPRVIAVLDWELSTLGNPLADFTYFLMNWINGSLAGIEDKAAHGAPTVDEVVAYYCQLTGRDSVPDLNWYFSYNAFRLAGILQGIVGRVRDGTANSPNAAANAERVPVLVKQAWDFALKSKAAR